MFHTHLDLVPRKHFGKHELADEKTHPLLLQAPVKIEPQDLKEIPV